jgi:hypothetical protein
MAPGTCPSELEESESGDLEKVPAQSMSWFEWVDARKAYHCERDWLDPLRMIRVLGRALWPRSYPSTFARPR